VSTEVGFPALIGQVDEFIRSTEESDVIDDVEAIEHDYGRTLAFDWKTMSFRISAQGAPVVVDGQAAIVESVIKKLMTPRYVVPIYSADYGAEFPELIGQPITVAMPEVKRIIEETVLTDTRVSAVVVLVQAVGDGGVQASITMTDFLGNEIRVPEIVVRYQGG
jgi:phage baseplate assembly protein W